MDVRTVRISLSTRLESGPCGLRRQPSGQMNPGGRMPEPHENHGMKFVAVTQNADKKQKKFSRIYGLRLTRISLGSKFNIQQNQ